MQKTKAKRHSLSKGSRVRFIALWVIIYFIAMFINQALHATNFVRHLTVDQANIVSGMVSLLPMLLQVLIVERLFRQSLRGWLVVTMLGTFITLLINPWVSSTTGNSEVRYFLTMAATIIPTLLFQTVWLWRRFKLAWIWLTLRVGRWMFWLAISRFFIAVSDTPFLWLMMALELIIEGAVIHTLLMHPRDTEKAKVDSVASDQSEDERVNRLKEHDLSIPLWNIGDDQVLHSET